jgi:hypothetical protein
MFSWQMLLNVRTRGDALHDLDLLMKRQTRHAQRQIDAKLALDR